MAKERIIRDTDEGALLERAWEDWRHAYGLGEAPEVINRHMHSAFVSGATTMYLAICEVMGGNSVSEDSRRMAAIKAELIIAIESVMVRTEPPTRARN